MPNRQNHTKSFLKSVYRQQVENLFKLFTEKRIHMVHMIELVRQGKVDFPHMIVSVSPNSIVVFKRKWENKAQRNKTKIMYIITQQKEVHNQVKPQKR